MAISSLVTVASAAGGCSWLQPAACLESSSRGGSTSSSNSTYVAGGVAGAQSAVETILGAQPVSQLSAGC